jgi:hypothetical protein
MSGINNVRSPSPASVFLSKPQTRPASAQQEVGESPAVEASETQTKQVQEGEAAPKPSANRLDIYA